MLSLLQPQLHQGSDGSASRSVPATPFLWMPQGPGGTTQQGTHGANCVRTGSGSVGLRSVNKVHGVASPEHQAIPNAAAIYDKISTCTQNTNDHERGAKVLLRHPDNIRQGTEGATARACSRGCQPGHPEHDNASVTHPPMPSVELDAMEQQQAETARQQQHPAARQAYTHQAEPRHSQQPATAGNMQIPSGGQVPPPVSMDQIHHSGRTLWGVRHVAGGWEARLGRQGHSRAKESLGIHPTGTLRWVYTVQLKLSCWHLYLK